MERLSIGEFARLSLLSAKALRLYDELGLLPPAEVEPATGYRFYRPSQLRDARLIAMLRRLDMPLSQIKTVLELPPERAAGVVSSYWQTVETDHGDRRRLAAFIIERLNGGKETMYRETPYDVTTRKMPERALLCLLRHAKDEQAVWAVGKEHIGYFRERPTPLMEGREGAPMLVYHGEVNADSDGPVEFCRPVPMADAEELAGHYPELTLRTEAAHEEAAVNVGTRTLSEAEWQLVSESLRQWADDHRRLPSGLGVRLTYLYTPPLTADSAPDIDFAVPLL